MGSSVSRFDIEFKSEDNKGQNESYPLPAGSLLQGQVVVELSSPIALHHQKSNDQHLSPAVSLRLYGKEKVRMNRSKAQKTTGTHPGSVPILAEHTLWDVSVQWPAFPSSSDNTNSNDQPSSASTTKRKIPAGTHVFPFQIQLPNNLPSSSYYPVHDNRARTKLKFRIQYKLMANLHLKKKMPLPSQQQQNAISSSNNNSSGINKHGTKNASKPQFTSTKYLWISASASHQYPLDPVPCMVEPISKEISSGYFRKGSFWFGASLMDCNIQKVAPIPPPTKASLEKLRPPPERRMVDPSTRASMDESVSASAAVVDLQVSCRNDSTAAIHRVQVSVLERLTWGTTVLQRIDKDTGTCRTSTALSQTETVVLVQHKNVPLPGLTKEHKGMFQSVVNTVFGGGGTGLFSSGMTTEHRLQRQIYDDLCCRDNPIHLELPSSARESYRGQLVQISHWIKIEFLTGAFICSPVLEIPIQVLACRCRSNNLSLPCQPARPSGAGDAYYIPPLAARKSSALSKKPNKPQLLLTAAVTGVSTLPTGSASTSGSSADTFGTDPAAAATIPSTSTATVIATIQRNKRHQHEQYSRSENDSTEHDVVPANTTLPPPMRISSLANLVPLSAPTSVMSIPALLGELRSSLNEFELIMDKLLDAAWVKLLQEECTPSDLRQIISIVHDFDQPRVAVVLAPHMNRNRSAAGGGGGGFTCEYAAAALTGTAVHHRAVMAQKLFPLCVDIRENSELVLVELNAWEQTVTETALQMAMR